MKTISKILALILAVAMLATVMVACGGKMDESKEANTATSEIGGADAPTVAGSEQTWGELTVFVPDSMTMEGGNGTYDPDDPKTLWLKDKEKLTNYIKVMIIDSEDNAKNNLETTKEMNEKYNPSDIKVTAGDHEWTGISYTASGYDCVMLYSVVGEKVYSTMSAGYASDGDVLKAVLSSLK